MESTQALRSTCKSCFVQVNREFKLVEFEFTVFFGTVIHLPFWLLPPIFPIFLFNTMKFFPFPPVSYRQWSSNLLLVKF